MNKEESILRQGYQKITFEESFRRIQYLTPYQGDNEVFEEVVIYKQHGLWYLFYDYELYMIDQELYKWMEWFGTKDVSWDLVMEQVAYPTFAVEPLEQGYKPFSVHDPVFPYYEDGNPKKVEYIQGEGVQPSDYVGVYEKTW